MTYTSQLTDYLHIRMKSSCKEERRDILEVLGDIKTARIMNRKLKVMALRQQSDNITTRQTNDNMSIRKIVRAHSFTPSRLGEIRN